MIKDLNKEAKGATRKCEERYRIPQKREEIVFMNQTVWFIQNFNQNCANAQQYRRP